MLEPQSARAAVVAVLLGLFGSSNVGVAALDVRHAGPLASNHSRIAAVNCAAAGAMQKWHPSARIMTTAVVSAIYWGKKWASSGGDVIRGVDAFMAGYSGSNYARTANEYSGSNGAVGSTIRYTGHVIVPTTTTSADPSIAEVQAVVCKAIPRPDPAGNGAYVVFYDKRRPPGGQRCGWHSYGWCNGVAYKFALIFNLAGDVGSPSCDAGDYVTGNSQALAATANVLAHELAEMRTDPNLDAWSDVCKQECADKCSWVFLKPYVTFTNGRRWRLQAEWSNRAHRAGTGSANLYGQRGCVSGA